MGIEINGVELTPGARVRWYPRAGSKGRDVEIVGVRFHPSHGAVVRFRDRRGDVRERTLGRFYTSPEGSS